MKRIIACIVCIMLALSVTGCAKITKTITKKPGSADNNSSSQTSSGTSSDNSSSSTQSTVSNSSTTSSNSSNTNSSSNDEIVDEVIKNAASFNGATADESGYNLYYVDSVSGSDSNDGRSPKSPWKTIKKINSTAFEPGTKVMIKCGSVFNEQLIPQSSGVEGKNFIIDSYGTGAKPIINGDGENAAVIISNLEYIEIRNLEITNISEYEGNRYGVLVNAGGQISSGVYQKGGLRNHIYLINLDVHDISCNEGSRFYGGIVFYSLQASSPTAFSDILVQGCNIKNTGGAGIVMASDYENGPGVGWSPFQYYPSQNVAVRGNYVGHIASDGIFMSAANNMLIEYNTVVDTSFAQGAYAGIWPHYSSNVVMQYNEAYDTKLVGGDGQGFDVDINCVNTVVQYNYSHDNEGGFILLCTDGSDNGYNKDMTVRYNISQNDMGQIFTLSGPISDVKVYNNTVYVKDGLNTRLIGSYDWGGGKSPADARFTNNIIYMNTAGNNFFQVPGRIVFNNNLFYGTYNYSNIPATNTITADPLFEAVGTGSIGLNTVTGYRLRSGSPCIDAGVYISQSGGKDYFGNAVPDNGKADIGAVEYSK